MRKYGIVFILWLLFSIGAVVAGLLTPLLALFYPFCKKDGQLAKMVEASDRQIACFYFGGSGRWTLSVECAHEKRNRHRAIKAAIDEIDPNHCTDSMNSEGAYCRITDRKWGVK